MKDLPHHIKKLNRRVIRSVHREEKEETTYDTSLSPPRQVTPLQQRKQKKIEMRKERLKRTPTPLTPEEQNRKMKKRVPVLGWDNREAPKKIRPTKKKTPRI